MKTTLLLHANNDKDIAAAAKLIQQGNLVAFPTETVYGLGAHGLTPSAIEKIYLAKNRPPQNPMILHVNTLEDAMQLWEFSSCDNPQLIKQRIQTLSSSFWPGPLSIICFKSGLVPDIVTAGGAKVAVRAPSHPIAQRLISLVGAPIVAPSANISSRPSATTAQDVLHTLNGKIDAVLDGGACEAGLESTVVDVTQEKPRILRLGSISFSAIKVVLPDLDDALPQLHTQNAEGSPGLLFKHYAPKVQQSQLMDTAEIEQLWQKPVTLMLFEKTHAKLTQKWGARDPNLTKTMPNTPALYASKLYATLYDLERAGTIDLVIERPAATDAWRTVLDRLERACQKETAR